MDNTRHTPGPWHLADHDVVATVDGDQVMVAGTYCGGYTRNGNADQQRHLANARLIAAAPDLLAALKYIADLRRHSRLDDLENVNLMVDRARDAIAKSQGTNP